MGSTGSELQHTARHGNHLTGTSTPTTTAYEPGLEVIEMFSVDFMGGDTCTRDVHYLNKVFAACSVAGTWACALTEYSSKPLVQYDTNDGSSED